MNGIFIAANPITQAYSQSDFFGRIIFLSLFALSFLSWGVLLYKVWLTRVISRLSDHFHQHFNSMRHHPLGLEVGNIKIVKGIPHPFLSLFQVLKKQTRELLRKNRLTVKGKSQAFLSPSDIDYLGAHLSNMISGHRKTLEKHLFVLSTIVSLAPFLGLLGTVWGILLTFSELQGSAGHSHDMILGGLAMALGTTVLGLVVAIPALIAYNYLKQAISNYITKIEDFANGMLGAVELQYRKVDVKYD